MRAISSFVLAGWLLGGAVPPCLAGSPCAGTARHECCCGGSGDCCCRLTADRSPVLLLNAAVLPPAPDLQGPPAPEASPIAGIETASPALRHPGPDLGRFESPPVYVCSRAFRC